MKNIRVFGLLVTLLLFLHSCAEKIVVNRMVDSEKYGKILLGYQTRSQFQKEPFNTWYDYEYSNYEYDKNLVDNLRKMGIKTHSIVLVLGTWCSDSQREVPRLMKILDAAGFPENRLKILSLTKSKESPGGEEMQFAIKKVPTIILYKYGKEIGRIVETPTNGSIERDLYDIIMSTKKVKKEPQNLQEKKEKKTKKVRKGREKKPKTETIKEACRLTGFLSFIGVSILD